MAKRRQTSVRVPERAIGALAKIAHERHVSREEAMRRLLDEHISAQLASREEYRLTHITTVLRYPPPALGRGASDGRVRLAVRLDEGIAARAGSMSLRLPGQAAQRAFKDYGARPLTDAVLAAIARVKPFAVHGLKDLPPLLTHRAALGLWRLTVAATLTRAEQHVLLGADGGDAGIVLREEDVAWHAPWRFEVAQHLARRLLTGAEKDENLQMLTAQEDAFRMLLFDFERTDDFDHPLLRGLSWPFNDLSGRGGAAVWRAERSLAMTDIARWLTSPNRPSSFVVTPPGWKLRTPSGWCGLQLPYGVSVPPERHADLAEGRVLRIEVGSKAMLWPYDSTGDPISGFDSVVSAAGDISPAALVEIVLVGRQDLFTYPMVPADKAHELGFIAAAEHDKLVTDAANRTRQAIESAMARAKRMRLSHDELAALHDAMSDPKRFVKLAADSHIKCRIVEPTWTWHVDSVAEALISGAHSGSRLEWLTGAMRRIQTYILERDMEEAWRKAFWLGRALAEDHV